MGNYKIKSDPLQIQCIKSGVVLPSKAGGGVLWGLGGVCDANNEFVQLSGYDGGWGKYGGAYPFDSVEEIDEEVIYFGLFMPHWGHYIVDLLSRLWCLNDNRYPIENIKIVYIGNKPIEGNYFRLFELFGLTREQLIHVISPTRFRNVIVPEVSSIPCQRYSLEYMKIFDVIRERALANYIVPDALHSIEHVYFTRTLFSEAHNKEFGESLLLRWAKDNFYTVLSPEKLTLDDQIYIWNFAKEIVCLNGSIPLNVIFSNNKDISLTVINKTSRKHENLEYLTFLRGVDPTYLEGYYESFFNKPKYLGVGPFVLTFSKELQNYTRDHHQTIPFSEGYIRIVTVVNTFKAFLINIGVNRIKSSCVSFLWRLIPNSVKKCIKEFRRKK